MAITPWFKPAELSITPLPFQQIAQAGAMMQKQYDTGQAAVTLLEDQFAKLKALPVDVEKRDAKLKEYRDQITQLYDKAGHNYAQMLPGLAQIERSFKQDATYGDLAGINSNAESYAQIVKEYKDAAVDGKFSGHDDLMWTAAIGNPLAAYNNSGGYRRDPKTNSGVSVGFGNLYKLPEVGKGITEFMKDWKPTTIQGGLGGDDHGYLSSTTHEFITKDEAYLAAMQFALGNPDFEQMNKLVAQTSDPNQTYDVKDAKGNLVTQLKGQSAGLYKFYAGIVDSAADKTAYDKVTRDYHYDQAAADARKAAAKNQIIDLNTPYDLAATSVGETISTLNSKLSGTALAPGVKEETYGYQGSQIRYYKIVNGQKVTVPAEEAFTKVNVGQGFGVKAGQEYPDAKFTTTNVYNSLSELDKQRVMFIAGKTTSYTDDNGNPVGAGMNLAKKDPTKWSKSDWEYITKTMAKYKDTNVSAIMHTYSDNETRTELGKYYNDNMANFYFYDRDNVLDGANKNRMYSGAELQAKGINIESIVGRLSAANVTMDNVPGQYGKYTFAAPDVARITNSDKSINGTFYIGRNRAQIDNAYILDVFENGLTHAEQVGLPMPLFAGSDVIVTPAVPSAPNASHALTIQIPGQATTTIQYNTPAEFRAATSTLLSQNNAVSTQLNKTLYEKLFTATQ